MDHASSAQIRISIAQRQANASYSIWEQSLKMLLNQWGVDRIDNMPLLAPNIMFATYRKLLASLTYNDPEFHVQAQSPDAIDEEDAVAATLFYHWRTLKGDEQSRLALADALLYPYGVIQIGMGRAYMTEKQLAEDSDQNAEAMNENIMLVQGLAVAVDDDDNHEIHITRHTELLNDPSILSDRDGELIIGVVKEHLKGHEDMLERHPAITSRQWGSDETQQPFIRRIRPHDFFWEPGASTLDDAGYIIVRSWERISEVKRNPQLQNTSELKATGIDPHIIDLFDKREKQVINDEVGRIALWNIYDMRERTWEVWTDGGEKPHFVFEDAETGSGWPFRYMKGYPFSLVTFHTVPDRIAGPGLMEYLKHPQDISMKIYESIATKVDRSNTKYTVVREMVDSMSDDTISQQLTNPEMEGVVFVNDHNAIKPIQNADLDPSFLSMLSLITQSVQQNTGLSDSSRSAITGATATEVSQAGSATNILIRDMLRQVIIQYEDLSVKLIDILKQYGPEEIIFRDARFRNTWVKFKRENILYDFAVTVDIPEPGDIQRRLTMWINLHHELASSPYAQGDGVRNIQKEMVKASGIRLWQKVIAEPSQEIMALIQHENELMQQGIPVQPIQGEHYSAHLEGHNRLLQQLTQQTQQLQQQIIGQASQQNPMVAQDPRIQQTIMQNDPASQRLQSILRIVQQHIDATRKLAPSAQTGRPRSAVAIPEGNVGRTQSILSAQQGAV